MNGNITTAPLGGNRNIKTKPLYQYDYGQVLKIVGVTLPAAYEVHFSNQLHGVATTQIGNADGVIIPDIYLTTGEPVYAWIYLHTGTDDGETEYTITIPVVRRASISNAEPTPVQQDVITQAIAALNTAVEQTAQDVQDATEAKEDAEEAAGNAYESAVAAAQSAANAGTYAGQAQSAQTASELAQQKAEEAQTGAQTAKWAAESAQTAAEAAQAGAVAARTGAETAQAWAVAARSGAEAAQHAAEAARDEITGLSATANTLPAGSQATASYSDGLLTIGVPNGEKGDTGDTGATPDLTIGTVQTLPAGSSATATITGTDEQPMLSLGIPKGDPGEVTQAEFDALADDVSDMQDTLEHKADINGYYTDMTVGNAEQLVSSQYVEDAEPYKFRTSGGSADIGNREYLDKVVGGTVAWNQQVRDEASENQTDYADVVTVTDAVVDDAAVSVRVEPVQDLHGQESPWPAGGGKNKFNGQALVNAYPSISECNTELGTGTYTLSLSVTNATSWRIAIKPVVNDAVASDAISVTSPVGYYWNSNASVYLAGSNGVNNIVVFTVNSTCKIGVSVVIGDVSSSTVVSNVQVESGSTATAFAPYENLCPISGWDEVKVYDDQRYGGLVEWNQIQRFDVGTSISEGVTYTLNNDGSISCSGTSTGNSYINIGNTIDNVLNHVLYIRGCPSGGSTSTFYYRDGYNGNSAERDIGNGRITKGRSRFVGEIAIWGGTDATGLVFKPQCFDLTKMFGATKAEEIYAMEQAESGAGIAYFRSFFPNDYYSYNAGQTMTVGQVNGEAYRAYTIEMPTEAGTVYGGVLTVNKDGSGSVDINHAVMRATSFSGSFGVTQKGYAVYVYVADGNKGKTLIRMCNLFKYSSYSYGTMPTYSYMGGSGANTTWTFILPSTVTNITEANQWIADNGGYIDFTYGLDTPLTYTLTATQVQTLLGTNNVWSDAGQVALTYTGTDEHLVLTSGRKYMTRISGTDSMVLGAGQEVTAAKGMDNVFDLTQMFGTAVADYVYQQGAGYFRRWFGGTRYAYNAGELISVEGLQSRDVVGFNQWDKTLIENGYVNDVTGEIGGSSTSKNTGYIPVIGGETYHIRTDATTGLWGAWYDSSKNYISGCLPKFSLGYNVVAPYNAAYMRMTVVYNNNNGNPDTFCINLSNSGTRNGSYEPYTHRSYPLDSTLTLRGIPKLGTSGVYWDGDEYGYDGGVTQRYKEIDLGTLAWGATNAYRSVYRAQANLADAVNGQRSYGIKSPIILSAASLTNSLDVTDSRAPVAGLIGIAYNLLFVTFSESKTASQVASELSGIKMAYQLKDAYVVTETAAPYQQIQQVDDWGTEEFVSTSIVPVGHTTRFYVNLRDKLQHLPALASANGSYLITQTDGQMVLTPFPAPPTTAGNYLLKATVSGGNATYSWVAQ